MGSIHKYTTSKGVVQYRVAYKKSGDKKFSTKRFKTRKEALYFLENESKTSPSKSDHYLISDLFQKYIDDSEMGRSGRAPIRPVTVKGYNLHKRHADAFFKNDTSLTLTTTRIDEFRDYLLKKFSRPQARKSFATFKFAMSYAARLALIPHDPSAGHSIAADRLTASSIKKIPSLDHARAILKATEDLIEAAPNAKKNLWIKNTALIHVMAMAGLRPGEAIGLARSGIDTKNMTIAIKQDTDSEGRIDPLKSSGSYRTVNIGKSTIGWLTHALAASPATKLDLAFPSEAGTGQRYQNVLRRIWVPVLKQAGLWDETTQKTLYTMHSLRHVRASLEIAAGANALEVKNLMGHSSIKVTYDIYGHLLSENESSRIARAHSIEDSLIFDKNLTKIHSGTGGKARVKGGNKGAESGNQKTLKNK